ncbi:hypothetical protein IFM89_009880 [Coptis chinensis]|uniref:Ubiquitin-like domain-containing protein n=1 Tax=Coptis chinensis TaxID=261450 RepID=A0A835LZ63_9MAGN|nr:hypothetical protein IFM89_009880 [Coptis chinensis]
MIEEREGIHIDKQVIHFNGKRLQLSGTLTDYGIENEGTLNLMLHCLHIYLSLKLEPHGTHNLKSSINMARTRLPKKPAEGHVDKKKRIMVPSEDSMDQQTPPGVESSTPLDTVEDKMQINFRLMKTIPLEVKKSDTIQNVRTEFSKYQGISMVNLKSLFFAGNWLENERKVDDYDIKSGSVISVFLDSGFRTQIHVKMSQTGNAITLDVDMRDTVLTVKSRIQNKEGIPVGQQELFYLGEELDDGRTIASYNIEGGSTIYAVFRLGDTMLISVTTEKNRTFSLKVKRWFTVLNVKFLIESMVGIPIGKQKLWLDKVELENDMTLADLHFSEGQTLNLRSDSMQIFIRVPSGKTINCRVDGSYTVQNVQEMIEEQEGIHIKSQRLIFGGMQLEPSRSLANYNIKEEATIHLVLRLCGC